jgi:two-component system response regulator YesN
MWKAVLIDDESVILNGLKILVKWEDYDIKIVGSATDGESGLKLIQSERPDIVILDIMMPKVTGLIF